MAMRANRTYSLWCLIGLWHAAPMALRAADDPKGYYGGTIQATLVNESYILRRGLDTPQTPDPSAASLSPERHWSKDGFDLVRTQGARADRLTGRFNGPRVSGKWSQSENGTQMLAGVFAVSRQGGGSGGGSGDRGASTPAPVKAAGMDGEYSGTVSSSDANATSGHIRFTVAGNALHGTVGGQWAGTVVEGTEKQLEQDDYSATFSGPVDADSGSFSANMTGKIGEMDFIGHIRGRIQGNDASGPWDAGNEWSKSSGTWHASRPQPPVIPGSPASSESTDIVNSPPPGITNVGDVPGPQDLEQTGTSIVLPGLLAATSIGIKALLDSRVPPPPVVDYGPAGPDASDDSTPQPDSSLAEPADASSSATAQPTPEPAPQPAPVTSEYGPEHAKAIQDWQD